MMRAMMGNKQNTIGHGLTILDSIGSQSYNIGSYNRLRICVIGGGGSGSGDSGGATHSGNGGNGGEVKIFDSANVSNKVKSISVTVGKGGDGGAPERGFDGNPSSCTLYHYADLPPTVIIASGGSKGNFGTEANGEIGQSGGRGSVWEGDSSAGSDGILFPPTGVKYGAGGGGGHDSYMFPVQTPSKGGSDGGGDGGFGNNNTPQNAGLPGTVFGAGGGGAAFSSSHITSTGGAGCQGAIIIYIE